mgnify:CR=1 FL=1
MEPSNRSKSTVEATSVFWDIEATDWKNVVCIGVKVGEGETQVVRSFDDLFRYFRFAFDPRYVWRAHWGGIYDHLLALDWALSSPDWTLKRGVHGSGFGTWSVDLEHSSGALWRLRDTARLMPSSLKQIGAAFGLAKLEVDRGNIDKLTFDECATYCMRDVDVLKRGYDAITAQWVLTCQELPRETIAATSTAYIRRTAIEDWGWTPDHDAEVYPAYHGGRCEVFRPSLAVGSVRDISSAYPHAMTRELPTRRIAHRLARKGESLTSWQRGDRLSIVRADVTVSPDAHYGALPYRIERGPLGGKLLFPTGRWVGLFVSEELQTAIDLGLISTYRVVESFEYDKEAYLAPFMALWYEKKQNATNEGERYAAKLAINSCSGKLVETPDHYELTEDGMRARAAYIEAANIPTRRDPHPYSTIGGRTIWEVPSFRHGGLRHSAAAAFVTARARVQLLHALYASKDPAYTDTDSVHSAEFSPGRLSVPSDGLGSWTHEADITGARYLAPKLYSYNVPAKERFVVKAKGFRIPKADDYATPADYREACRTLFDRIARGESIENEATRLFKSALRAGDTAFERINVSRTYKRGVGKRHPSGRPWTVGEIMDSAERR